jgi:2-keto-4-pentenoate hydratase
LWQSSFYEAEHGKVSIPADDFLQPRIEGEVAFLIGKSLRGPNITLDQILAATEACALGIEIVASRIAGWKIKLVDTFADNASYGGFSAGPWDRKLVEAELSQVNMTIRKNGEPAGESLGAAVLGHPANAAAWLANKLLEFGVSLEPGDIVISGAFMKMLPFQAGDDFVFSLTSQPDLVVSIV